jgi:TolB protein
MMNLKSVKRILMLQTLALSAVLLAASACGGSSGERRIVYEASNGDVTNIFTIDANTGDKKQITYGDEFDGNPAWAPDHKRIIFASNRETPEKNDIWIMDADGSHPRAITSTEDAAEWSPKFSPDGKRIAYAGQDAEGGWDIRLMNADGSGDHELAGPYKFSEFPAWTRDGREVYFAAIPQDKDDTDIFSVDVASLNVVTRIATPGGDLCPHFSRDGEYMTYATSPSGEEDNVDLFRHEISSDDTTGASDERLTTSSASDDYGNPSPDGKRYVFVSKRHGNFDLYLMDADGSHQRRLTNTPDARENVPDW